MSALRVGDLACALLVRYWALRAVRSSRPGLLARMCVAVASIAGVDARGLAREVVSRLGEES